METRGILLTAIFVLYSTVKLKERAQSLDSWVSKQNTIIEKEPKKTTLSEQIYYLRSLLHCLKQSRILDSIIDINLLLDNFLGIDGNFLIETWCFPLLYFIIHSAYEVWLVCWGKLLAKSFHVLQIICNIKPIVSLITWIKVWIYIMESWWILENTFFPSYL